MKQNILPAIRLTAVFLLVLSGFYTLLIFGIAQFAPNNGKGEIIINEKSNLKNQKPDDTSNSHQKLLTIMKILVRNSTKINISGLDLLP